MKYLADLHIHSPFSRATSKKSDLPGLFSWARVKGINVVGTGDFTHPGWLTQLKELLAPAEPGFFRMKDETVPDALGIPPEAIPVRFVLTAEISSIYKRHQKVRKVHNILFVPDFESVERINIKLAGIGNIESDGRPILGLDSRDLLEILLEQAPDGFLVPAHIWTPWFSLFGSKSGFDAIEDCFGDLTEHIFALETGLSSDPAMNRLVSALDRFTLISNSDCHSPSKLGREVNLFDTGFDYFSMRKALEDPSAGFGGTVEFFPEEGKYHFDGHRKCKVCLDPLATRSIESICPVCNSPLTIGVSHRVMELADRTEPHYPSGRPDFTSLVPLPELLGEILQLGPATKGVTELYTRTIKKFGSEFNLLLKTPIEDINAFSTVLGESITRIRSNKVIRKPGFDGEFGVIHVFEEGELDLYAGQISLFSGRTRKKKKQRNKTSLLPFTQKIASHDPVQPAGLNPEQEQAVFSEAEKILVTAGPGSGKTSTLIARIARLLKEDRSPPHKFVAITFTNKAADEIKKRLHSEVGEKSGEVFVGTFHGFCLLWLRRDRPDISVLGNEARELVLKRRFPGMDRSQRKELLGKITEYYESIAAGNTPAFSPKIDAYLETLNTLNSIDIDAVIPVFAARLREEKVFYEIITREIDYLFVDEFQDVNRSQYELVSLLGKRASIFAIGDPDQAIYGFRGSSLEFFFQFADNATAESPVQRINLTRNYRSAPAILSAASSVIKNNRERSGLDLLSQKKGNIRLETLHARTPAAEAEFVVRRIEEIMGGISHFSINTGRGGSILDRQAADETGSISFGDIAVLFRVGRQADELGKALRRRGIPFQLIGSTPYFMSPGLRPVYYWLLAAAGTADVAEHLCLLREIKGIGEATLNTLETISIADSDFFATASSINLQKKILDTIRGLNNRLRKFAAETKAIGLLETLKKTMKFLSVDPGENNAMRLLTLSTAFGSDLAAFAHHLKQNSQATVYDERAEAVSLMTFHAAKGLEFPVVFLTGLEEGIMPHSFEKEHSDIEEERRLFYVALTRAKDALILTSSMTRTMYGRTNNQTRSRFLNEIPPHLISRSIPDAKSRKKTQAKQMRLF